MRLETSGYPLADRFLQLAGRDLTPLLRARLESWLQRRGVSLASIEDFVEGNEDNPLGAIATGGDPSSSSSSMNIRQPDLRNPLAPMAAASSAAATSSEEGQS